MANVIVAGEESGQRYPEQWRFSGAAWLKPWRSRHEAQQSQQQ